MKSWNRLLAGEPPLAPRPVLLGVSSSMSMPKDPATGAALEVVAGALERRVLGEPFDCKWGGKARGKGE